MGDDAMSGIKAWLTAALVSLAVGLGLLFYFAQRAYTIGVEADANRTSGAFASGDLAVGAAALVLMAGGPVLTVIGLVRQAKRR